MGVNSKFIRGFVMLKIIWLEGKDITIEIIGILLFCLVVTLLLLASGTTFAD